MKNDGSCSQALCAAQDGCDFFSYEYEKCPFSMPVFHSISVQFLFNFYSISVVLLLGFY